MGKVMPRYCNVCGRLVTPREIERGNAIVYGMHCYCSKCKEELMPIVEALKKRSQKEDARTKQQKRKRAKLQKATRTQVFFRRSEAPKRRKPAFKHPPVKSEPVGTKAVKAEDSPQSAHNTALEPVDFSKLKPVGKEVPLPPGPVKIGGKLIEVTPDGIRQQIRPPRGSAVRPPHSRRPTTRHHIPHRPPTKRDNEKSPPPPPQTKPSGLFGRRLTLILLVFGIGGGFSYYFLIHRDHSSDSSTSGTVGRRQDEKERQVAQQIAALKKRVDTLSNPSDWLSLKRQIKKLLNEVDGGEKAHLERLLAGGEVWFKEQEKKMAEQRRREAKKEWARIKQEIARVLKERKFETALQFARAFLTAYKGTGPDKDAAQMLTKIEAQKRAWELRTLIHNGQFRKGYWQTENLTVKKTQSGVLVSAQNRDGKLTLSADISDAEIFICLRRLKGKPAVSLPKSANSPIIEMVTSLFPNNRDTYLKLQIQDRRLVYCIGTNKKNLTPYAPKHLSGTDGFVFLLPAGSALLLKSVTVTRR